jgi:hypothetical protein
MLPPVVLRTSDQAYLRPEKVLQERRALRLCQRVDCVVVVALACAMYQPRAYAHSWLNV